MKMRAALRSATADAHDEVDRLYSRFDLADRGGYLRFLTAQAAAFLPVEEALDEAGAAGLLPDWPGRRRGHYLRQDISALGGALPQRQPRLEFHGAAAVLGAIYVLEGSRLGGNVLKRGLPGHWPQAFLSAPQPPGSWRRLIERIEALAGDGRGEAIESAKQVFRCFADSGRQLVENDEA